MTPARINLHLAAYHALGLLTNLANLGAIVATRGSAWLCVKQQHQGQLLTVGIVPVQMNTPSVVFSYPGDRAEA